MSLKALSRDTITILKPDGQKFEDVKANVQPKMIFIHDEMIPLEENDKIFRKLPNGLIEEYIVLDRGYYSALSGIPGHYQAKVQKEGTINENKLQSIINYNLNGTNSKVNVNSTDNSVNYFGDNTFNELRESVSKNIEDKVFKEEILNLIEKLEQSQKTPNFIQYYQEFISLMANQITIISPFIPALTQMF